MTTADQKLTPSNGKPVSLEQAVHIALGLSQPGLTETVPLHAARDRVLAASVRAQIDVPPFPRAMMDGYAIRADDVRGMEAQLKVIGYVAAGDADAQTLADKEAVRIATGAPLPKGADSVARFEWSREIAGDYVRFVHPITVGESVQQVGEDAQRGQNLLHPGMRLNGARRAICRAFGVHHVEVAVPPRIAIVVTGSELVEDVCRPLDYGQIYANTDTVLTDALERDGCKVVSVDYVGDHRVAIGTAVTQAALRADYLLVTGGVSAGDFDHVPGVLRELGAELALERVLIRPGARLVATRLNDAVVFAMSGNPAACLIQFELFVRPSIRKTLGLEETSFPDSGKLQHSMHLKALPLVRVFRAEAAIRDGEVWVNTALAQSAGVISGFATANCLVRMDTSDCAAETVVPLRWLD